MTWNPCSLLARTPFLASGLLAAAAGRARRVARLLDGWERRQRGGWTIDMEGKNHNGTLYSLYLYICVCVYIYICNKNVARLACHGEEFACWALSRFWQSLDGLKPVAWISFTSWVWQFAVTYYCFCSVCWILDVIMITEGQYVTLVSLIPRHISSGEANLTDPPNLPVSKVSRDEQATNIN